MYCNVVEMKKNVRLFAYTFIAAADGDWPFCAVGLSDVNLSTNSRGYRIGTGSIAPFAPGTRQAKIYPKHTVFRYRSVTVGGGW